MDNDDRQIVNHEEVPVWLGLGANLGNRRETLRKSLAYINGLHHTKIISLSSLYETEPVGKKNQPMFLNCVAEITTRLSPTQLLRELKRIEELLGRQHRERWEEREIDIDIILYDDRHINKNELQIPHPELHKRGFVLVPLAELTPDFIHPLFDRTITELLLNLGTTDGIVKLEYGLEFVDSPPQIDRNIVESE
ncbi:MAG: 2-amino-4-hydroxy-6-hydroxymethyldihydropteridine diphosphokinase [Chlorobi bacterium]|nr:2-amino-4-hydroxy-6-hydroxymethyldihydropteridine diphosphokinase [Chlorobiota bacterium]